jgi:hypothetical protein
MSSAVSRADAVAWEQGIAELRAAARWGAADLETIEATLGRLRHGDRDSWLVEWTTVAGALWAQPLGGGHHAGGAATGYLSAASYYAAALGLMEGTDGSVNEDRLRQRQRECWDLAADSLNAERLAIPFERTELPGYFFSGGNGRRPLILIDHGGRVATSDAWIRGGAAARARGFHWLTFDGPGRQVARRNHNLTLRPDWEVVVDAVVTFALARSDVDRSRVALVGADHAGLGIARALISEHRCAAAALLPGIVDASRPLVAELPPSARAALHEDDRDRFETELRLASLFAPNRVAHLRRLTRDYGRTDEPLFDVFRRALEFRLDAGVGSITTPLAIASADAGSPWSGQAKQLRELVPQAQSLGEVAIGDETAIDWIAGEF